MLEKIILIRNLFYKCTLISFVYFIFVSLFYMFNKEWAANFSANLYNINNENFYLILIYFLGWMKIFTFYVFLVPALALHWTAYKLKKDQK
ncbi:MAG TPA: hypothetical protein DDW90_09135 [Cyanobacteria bacterium UBA9971]|nr:hypothetical protein [Cyanobacteria bacterium UBA9971]